MKTNSIWAENAMLPNFPALEQDAKTDVLVLGGGLTGLLCAYFLHQAGINYLLIEADRICGGISRNTTAKITTQHGLIYHKLLREFDPDTARLYWKASDEALQQYRRLCSHIECGFDEQDAFLYAMDSSAPLQQELDALRQLGIPAEYTAGLPLPWQTTGAIRFAGQAQFHPLQFAATLARGLNVREHTAAREWKYGMVATDKGRIRADKVIVATHFPLFNKHGGYSLKLFQHRSYVIALENADPPDGMYLDGSGTGFSVRRQGSSLLLGGGAHRTGKIGGGWEELIHAARQYWPNAHITHRWAAQDCMTLDGIPYIGQYAPGTPELFVATGFNKWGMTSAMTAALLLTDLVQGKPNPYAAVFSPQRTILRPQLAANAGHTLLGLLTPTLPRCPHLGCALHWNPQERSWDCPCHGSRFATDGSLLDGPATADHPGKLPPRN